MGLPPKHLPLQRVVAQILTHPHLKGKLCTVERLCPIINASAGSIDDESIAIVDPTLIKRAFKDTANTEYFTPYRNSENEVINLNINDVEGDRSGIIGKSSYLFVRIDQHDGSGGRVSEIGRFTSMMGKPKAPKVGLHNDTSHPLSVEPDIRGKDYDIFQWMHNNKDVQDLKEGLVNYLRAIQKLRNKNAKSNAKKTKQQQEEVTKRVVKLSALNNNNNKRKSLETPPSGTSSNNNTPLSNVSTSNKNKNKKDRKKTRRGGRKKKRKSTPTKDEIELDELMSKYDWIQAGIQERITSLRATRDEINTLKSKIQNNNKENNGDNNNNTTNVADSPTTSSPTESIDDTLPIYYSMNGGRVGTIDVKNTLLGSGIILVEDLISGLEPLPSKINNEEAAETRRRKKWTVSSYGATQVIHPHGTHLVTTRQLNRAKKNNKIIKKLDDLFGGKQSNWSRKAMMIMTAGGLHNYGGSDEAFGIMISTVFKALFDEIGYKISHIQLARGCPSRRTIARYEYYFAADCLVKVIYEIKSDGATEVSIIFDHGHRGGQDHFVVVIVWSAIDKKTGRRTFKRFCPSIDSAGHKTDEAAAAIKMVIERTLPDVNVKVTSATGDSGGGGAIQKMEQPMKENGVLAQDGLIANCVCHGFQKSLENASTLTTGASGNGKRCPDQLVYSFSIMCSTIRTMGGMKLFDELWNLVGKEMLTNPEWKQLAEQTMGLPWNEFMCVVQALSEPEHSSQAEELMSDFTFKAPRGIQEPTWSRWQSTIKVVAILLDNWASVYFLAVALKTHFSTDRYLCKVACTVISLMNEREEAKVDNSATSHDNTINATNVESPEFASVTYTQQNQKSPPTFYLMLLFRRAFCECAFNDVWKKALQNDPYFGPGTFGNCSRLMCELSVILHKQVAEMKKDDHQGWMNMKAFEKYKNEIKKVPENVDGDGADRKFFQKELPQKFLDVFSQNLNKHIYETWWSTELIHYMLGGDSVLAKEFAKMLVHYKNEYDTAMTTDGNETEVNASIDPYPFNNHTPATTTLGLHHVFFDETKDRIVLDVQRTMELVTASVDWYKVVKKNKFVDEHWNEIKKLAEADGVVNLFMVDEDGKIDKSTWGEIDYTSLLDGIWRSIGIHSHHQQLCENYVQMAALIAKTKVGESRRTWRAIGMSTLIRPFNLWAIERVRASEKDEEKRKKLNRVEGTSRIALLSEFIDLLLEAMDEARAETPPEQYTKIVTSIRDKTDKASQKEKDALVLGITRATKKKSALKPKAMEKVKGFDRTSTMRGKITVSKLTKSRGLEHLLDAEFRARNIFTMRKFVEEYGEEASLDEITIQKKKDWIKEHEAQIISEDNTQLSLKEAKEQAKDIKPLSKELTDYMRAEVGEETTTEPTIGL